MRKDLLIVGTYGRSIDEEVRELERLFRERMKAFSSRLAYSNIHYSGP